MNARRLRRSAMGMIALALIVSSIAVSGEPAGPITAEKAVELALEQTGGGDIVEVDSHRRGYRVPYFRVVVMNSDGVFQVELEADSGKLLKFIKKHDNRRYPVPMPELPATPVNPAAPVDPAIPAGQTLTYEQALALAMQQTGGGVLVESEIDRKRYGGVIYEFEIVNDGVKFEVDIDGVDGGVYKFKQKGWSSLSPRRNPQTRLTAEAAQAIAKEKAGGGAVAEYELDRDDGILVHEITIVGDSARYEFKIADDNGEILEYSVKRF